MITVPMKHSASFNIFKLLLNSSSADHKFKFGAQAGP